MLTYPSHSIGSNNCNSSIAIADHGHSRINMDELSSPTILPHNISSISSGCNLIIQQLPAFVDESLLRERFSHYGKILRVKIIRKPKNRRSLSYGFVVYSSKTDADTARVQENGALWGNQSIRVNYAKNEINVMGLLVTNIPKTYTVEMIRELFGQCGVVQDLQLKSSSTSYQNYLIRYQHFDECQAAILKFNEKIIEGASHPIYVLYSPRSKEHQKPPKIKNLHKRSQISPKSVHSPRKESVLAAVDSPRAVSTTSSIDSNSDTIMPFTTSSMPVTFKSSSGDIHAPPLPSPIDYTFFISNLPPSVTALQLVTIFSSYGHIYDLQIQTMRYEHYQHLCDGTAIIRCYGSTQLRNSAVTYLNNAVIFPYHPPISVSLVLHSSRSDLS